MIRIDEVLTFEGLTVYRDENQRNLFYVLPGQPTFRLDDAGLPVFKFLKYRTPITRADGSPGGGFVIFDAEFAVPADKLKKLQTDLDTLVANEKIVKAPAQIGQFTYTRGTATLQLLDSPGTGGTLVEKVTSAGKPSLFGNNVSSFTAQLSPQGATIVEQALQGKGGVAQVIYDLHFITRIPPTTGRVWFKADKFYSYWQSISKTDSHWWNGNSGQMKDTRREQFTSSDSGGVDLNINTAYMAAQDPDAAKALADKIRDWAWSTLEDATKSLVLTDPTANTDTGLPDGVNYVTRDFSSDKTSSFDRYLRESDAVEWGIAPQGTLPNITNLPGVKVDDYFRDIDANDPFFNTLNVNVGVNADFAKFGIHSVDFSINYGGKALKPLADAKGVIAAEQFTTPDQRLTYAQYLDAGNGKYTYSFQVHYTEASQFYQSPVITSDAQTLTLDLDGLGLLAVDVINGGIDWTQVAQAEVTLTYQDPANNVAKLEKRLILTKTDTQFTWNAVIMAPRTQPVTGSVTYTMLDGSTHQIDGLSSKAPQIYIDDPFFMKTVHIRTLGDFTTSWDTVYLDLTYTDAANKFTQTASPALTKASQFFDWTFPALNGSKGTVTYSGRIKRQDGTTLVLAETPVTEATIYINETGLPPSSMDVAVIPDLVDWTQVKLVVVKLSYPDGAQSESLAVKPTGTPAPWHVKLSDPTKKSFTWSATFYLANGTSRVTAPATTDDTNVVLQLPTS